MRAWPPEGVAFLNIAGRGALWRRARCCEVGWARAPGLCQNSINVGKGKMEMSREKVVHSDITSNESRIIQGSNHHLKPPPHRKVVE